MAGIFYFRPFQCSCTKFCLDESGPESSTRGIFVFYDIFGYFTQTIRGIDILSHGFPSQLSTFSDSPQSSHKTYRTFTPDFFSAGTANILDYPPKTPQQTASIMAFMNGPASPAANQALVAPLMAEIMAKNPHIKEWGVVGYCWGAKMVAINSREGSVFKAGAMLHPSLLDQGDAGKVVVPMCVLSSVDEIPEEVDPWCETLKSISPESFTEVFEDQVHGWMSSRADFENQHNFEEFLRGYKILREFFAKHLV